METAAWFPWLYITTKNFHLKRQRLKKGFQCANPSKNVRFSKISTPFTFFSVVGPISSFCNLFGRFSIFITFVFNLIHKFLMTIFDNSFNFYVLFSLRKNFFQPKPHFSSRTRWGLCFEILVSMSSDKLWTLSVFTVFHIMHKGIKNKVRRARSGLSKKRKKKGNCIIQEICCWFPWLYNTSCFEEVPL